MLYPDFNELLQYGNRTDKWDINSKRPVLSNVAGQSHSPFRGQGLEFEEVREYVHGDDIRNIDWRVTARTGKPHLKLFSEERERSVMVCVDVNHTMKFGTKNTFKSIQAARAAALLTWSAIASHNRVGSAFFGNVPGGMAFVDPSRSRRALWRTLKQLCDHTIYYQESVSLSNHLQYLNKAVPSGALVFIISDFMTIDDALKKRLANLHRHADVVLISINDPAEAWLPSIGDIKLSDDHQSAKIDSHDATGGERYHQHWQQNRQALKTIVQSLGLSWIKLFTPDDVRSVLRQEIKLLARKRA